jgi:hypothetical protein
MRILHALCLAALLALPFPTFAGEALVNNEVSVDVTGKDAADARAQAMAQGEVDALRGLLAKLAPSGQADDIVGMLDAKKISAMVKGTEVLDERIASNRYRARLLISFDADAISALIGKFGASNAKEDQALATGAFLIIPAYEDESGAVLWEEGNPWRDAWRMLALEFNSGDIVVPFGDKKDIQIVDGRTLASATYASLVPLTIRYGVSDIVILQAKYSARPEMELKVVKRRINRTRNEVNLLSYRADLQETRDTLLARAARDVADNLQDKKTEEISMTEGVSGGERNKVMVLASITTMASWTQLRAKLSSLPMIDRLELLAMSPSQVDMIVHYRGSPESLAGGMTAQGLRLAQNANYWVVSRD